MRNLYLAVLSSFIALTATSQTTYTWKGGSGSWNTSTNWTPSGIPGTISTDIARFDDGGTSAVTITSNYSIGKLIITGSSNVTITGSSNKTITVGNGYGTDFTIDAGSALTLGTSANLTIANNTAATIAGTLNVTNKTFDTDNTGALTTVTGTLQNSGTVSGAADKLSFSGNGTYIHARTGGTIPTATWATTSTCKITGSTSGDANGDEQAFGNLTYDCPDMTGTRNVGGSNLTIAGNLHVVDIGDATLQVNASSLTVGGNFILDNGTFKIAGNNTRTLTVNGNVTINNGTLVMSTGNSSTQKGNLEIGGNFSINGGTITETNNGSGVITFNGSGTQTFSKSSGSFANTINFVINDGATVDLGSSVINGSSGSFTLNSGGKMIAAGSNPIQVSGTKTFSSSADYEFKSSTTGTFTTTPAANTVRNLTINNASGSVTLSQPFTVTGDLKLQSGELVTSSANLLTINDNATISAYSNSSFITGPVLKKGDDDFIFPVGRSGSGVVPIKISGLSGSSDFKAEYKRSATTSVGTSITASGLHHLSACEYWTLDRTGSATANVTLYWNPYSNCNAAAYVSNLSTIVVAHFNGTSWNAYGRNGGTTGTISSGTVTWNNVSSFSPFALGSTSGVDNPLPVTLANVKAYSKNNGIQIEWSNLTEKDVADYTVERSGNGNDFTVIKQYQPKRNQNDRADYDHFDAMPLQGTNFYRVKIKEISGKITISKILRVEDAKTRRDLIMYPNPVTGNQFNIGMTDAKKGPYKLRVINAAGEDVFRQTFMSEGTVVTQTVQLPSTIKPGVYTLILTGFDYHESKMFVVK